MTGDGARQLIILVHGIRDFARWQAEIASTLREEGFEVELTNYGRMNLIEFLLPISFFRNRALETVWTQMQHAAMLHPNMRVSIIAHSFGTYIIANILRRQFNLRVDRVIFCGSVVRFNFPFEQINERFDSPILNEVGTADPWPAIAESVTTGYGSAGTYGFRRAGVRDRFHNDAPHGHFLNAEFCRKFWIPFLRNGTLVPGCVPAKNPPWWVRIVSIFKLKYLILAVLILFAAMSVLRLLWGPEEYSYDFNRSNSRFVYWNASIEQIRRDTIKPCWMPSLLCRSAFLTQVVTGRQFRNVSIFDEKVRNIVSCTGFRYPTDAQRTTSDPFDAFRALAKTFPTCLRIEESGTNFSVTAKTPSMTSVHRPANRPAYICDCDSSSVSAFRATLP